MPKERPQIHITDLYPHKRVADTNFVVDCFNIDVIGASKYFLSHFHADHYQNLCKRTSLEKKIYATRTTCNLAHMKLRVPRESLFPIDLYRWVRLDKEAYVFAIDANHCPGACCFIFHINGRLFLHTGDFRCSEEWYLQPQVFTESQFEIQENENKTFELRKVKDLCYNRLDNLISVHLYSLNQYNMALLPIFQYNLGFHCKVPDLEGLIRSNIILTHELERLINISCGSINSKYLHQSSKNSYMSTIISKQLLSSRLRARLPQRISFMLKRIHITRKHVIVHFLREKLHRDHGPSLKSSNIARINCIDCFRTKTLVLYRWLTQLQVHCKLRAFPLEEILTGKLNPRKHFDYKKLLELVSASSLYHAECNEFLFFTYKRHSSNFDKALTRFENTNEIKIWRGPSTNPISYQIVQDSACEIFIVSAGSLVTDQFIIRFLSYCLQSDLNRFLASYFKQERNENSIIIFNMYLFRSILLFITIYNRRNYFSKKVVINLCSSVLCQLDERSTLKHSMFISYSHLEFPRNDHKGDFKIFMRPYSCQNCLINIDDAFLQFLNNVCCISNATNLTNMPLDYEFVKKILAMYVFSKNLSDMIARFSLCKNRAKLPSQIGQPFVTEKVDFVYINSLIRNKSTFVLFYKQRLDSILDHKRFPLVNFCTIHELHDIKTRLYSLGGIFPLKLPRSNDISRRICIEAYKHASNRLKLLLHDNLLFLSLLVLLNLMSRIIRIFIDLFDYYKSRDYCDQQTNAEKSTLKKYGAENTVSIIKKNEKLNTSVSTLPGIPNQARNMPEKSCSHSATTTDKTYNGNVKRSKEVARIVSKRPKCIKTTQCSNILHYVVKVGENAKPKDFANIVSQKVNTLTENGNQIFIKNETTNCVMHCESKKVFPKASENNKCLCSFHLKDAMKNIDQKKLPSQHNTIHKYHPFICQNSESDSKGRINRLVFAFIWSIYLNHLILQHRFSKMNSLLKLMSQISRILIYYKSPNKLESYISAIFDQYATKSGYESVNYIGILSPTFSKTFIETIHNQGFSNSRKTWGDDGYNSNSVPSQIQRFSSQVMRKDSVADFNKFAKNVSENHISDLNMRSKELYGENPPQQGCLNPAYSHSTTNIIPLVSCNILEDSLTLTISDNQTEARDDQNQENIRQSVRIIKNKTNTSEKESSSTFNTPEYLDFMPILPLSNKCLRSKRNNHDKIRYHICDLKCLFFDNIYLDNTYEGFKHFENQDIIIHNIISKIESILYNKSVLIVPKSAFIFTTYCIGKEKIFFAVAEYFNFKIYVQEQKKKVFDCFDEYAKLNLDQQVKSIVKKFKSCRKKPYLHMFSNHLRRTDLYENVFERFSQTEHECEIFLIPQMHVEKRKIESLIKGLGFQRVYVFVGSGWNEGVKYMGFQTHQNKIIRKGIEIHYLPYSEHSSSSELTLFTESMNYIKIINTVNNKSFVKYKDLESVLSNKSTTEKRHS